MCSYTKPPSETPLFRLSRICDPFTYENYTQLIEGSASAPFLKLIIAMLVSAGVHPLEFLLLVILIFIFVFSTHYSISLRKTGRCSAKDLCAASAMTTGTRPSSPVTGTGESLSTASTKAAISATKLSV